MERVQLNNESLNRQKINLVLSSPFVLPQLQDNNLTWIAKYGELAFLDVTFVPRGGYKDKKIAGINIFGINNCAGLCIVESKEEFLKKTIEIEEKFASLGFENGDKPNIAVVVIDDLDRWKDFYTNPEITKVLSELGYERTDKLLGLDRATPERSKKLFDGFLKITQIYSDHFAKFNINSFEADNNFDLVFKDAEGETGEVRFLPLFNVRRYIKKEGIIISKVSKGVVNVAGVVIQRPGESTIELVDRAKKIEVKLTERFKDKKIKVPIIKEGQLSLFQKLGLEKSLRPVLDKTKVSLRELYDFLYFGQSSGKPGVLADKSVGLSLPSRNTGDGADILFLKRFDDGGKRISPINHVLGLDLHYLKKGIVRFKPISNVGGMIIMPDSWSVEQMHEHAKRVTRLTNRYRLEDDVHLLYLTKKLFNEWRKNETIFADDKKEDLIAQENTVYGYGHSRGHTASVVIPSRGATIGDAQYMIETREGSNIIRTPMDWGAIYSGISRDEKGLLSGVTSATGIRHGLQNGSLPLYVGIYNPNYLLAAAKYWEGLSSETNRTSISSFVRAELVSRVPYSKLVSILGKTQAEKIHKLGIKDVRYWYGNNDISSKDVLISHAHNDHDGQTPFLIGQYVVTWQTAGLLVGESNRGGGWWKDHRSYYHVEEGLKSGKYDKDPRFIQRVYYNGDGKEISPGVNTKTYFTDHSLPGSAIGIETENGKLLYSGDIQPGPLTDIAVELIAKDDYDVFLWECTNPPNSWKPSALATKEIVTANIANILNSKKSQGKLVIVVAPPNGIEKVEMLSELAKEYGRDLVVSYSHAEVIKHLKAELDNSPLNAQGRNLYIPEVGQDVGLYVKPMVRPRPYQIDLAKNADVKHFGIYTQGDLISSGGDIILVVSPYESFKNIIGGAEVQKPIIVYSSPYPYDIKDRQHLGSNLHFMSRYNPSVHADFSISGLNGGLVRINEGKRNRYHWTGHATFEENMRLIQRALGDKPSGKVVYFVHGENPIEYAVYAEDWFKKHKVDGVRFVGKFNKYKHNDPINFPGHIIKINR